MIPHHAHPATLAYHLDVRPFARKIDMGKVSMKVVADWIGPYGSWGEPADPHTSAIDFYLFNHALSVLRSQFHRRERLPEDLCQMVHDGVGRLSLEASRMCRYLILICSREIRHNAAGAMVWTTIGNKFGQPIATFLKGQHGKGSEGAAQRVIAHAPDAPFGAYANALSVGFHEGSYSGGYGGHPWGNVADCLHNYAQGAYSAEMMLDVAYTLAHNNGPIFNKGMLYSMYNKALLLKILDVQRAGQIPALVDEAAKQGMSSYVSEFAENVMRVMRPVSGFYDGNGIDWQAVVDAGAVQHYSVPVKPKPYVPPKPLFDLGTGEKIEILTRAEL